MIDWCEKQDNEMETIEIGAVKFHAKTFDLIDEFQIFIRPTMNPTLTDFCKNLTSISQSDVDSAKTFKDSFIDFQDWAGDTQQFLAWGAFDYFQLRDDCKRAGIHCFAQRKYLNAKLLYTYFTGIRGAGLSTRMKSHGLEFEGTAHRALDDAKNTLRVLKEAWKEF